MTDWLKDWWWVIVIACVGVATGIQERRERAAFLADCSAVHRRFECESMWRANEGVHFEFNAATTSEAQK